jgi:hypothetical protein
VNILKWKVDLDVDVDALSIYDEFKRYDELIGIYVFTANRKYLDESNLSYLLLYGSS